jgi:pSer/pThr/pTyr-binding forkhead associated (FHA) protein
MPTLTLKFKENTIEKYQLEKGKSLTIGRRDDNNIIIENLAVSGHHAKIDSVGDGFVLTDLQSKNGSFVNEQLVTSHWLKNADIISIGKHILVFDLVEGETQAEDPAGDMDKTMVMDTSSYRNMLSKSTPDDAPSQETAQKKQVGVLSYLAGGEGEYEITKKLIKIGKDTASDIIVSGFTVGKTAATISKRPNGYYLSYVGGSKLKVNGEVVKDSKELKEFDVIEVGNSKLQFFTKE